MRRTKKTVATPSLFSVRGCVPGLHCLRLPVEPDKHPRSLHGRQPLHQLGFERFCRCRLICGGIPAFFSNGKRDFSSAHRADRGTRHILHISATGRRGL